ncbi:hypothetical protein QQ045_012371 [Rhodiola kirilowii]
MLSYENNPPDPVNSIGKSTVKHKSSDENITRDNHLPEVEHQLILSSVDAQNFSIRDFVLAARSKNIETNWPFPDKHLKLCLKHGVKDLLPPFQSKLSKRKQSFTVCLDKTSLADGRIITRTPDEQPSAKVDSLTVCSLGDVALTEKVTADHFDASFDKSDKDSEFPSSVTSNSQSYSYPSRSGGTFKHHKFSKASAKLSAKKCKLIVKFGSPSVPSSNEEIMPHKTNLSESPASKVCPVCKTFSSSSNTTLNAHIDQCLSMEETSEVMTDSKIGAKCKVKPRKMRSMVDIYATALECTIEDLDRRNGSSWATDLSMPARDNSLSSAQGNRKQITSPTEHDKDDDDGGVYVDANGRKLRILSKIDRLSSVVATKEGHGSKRPQMSNILSSSKKKHHGVKHHKGLRLAVSNKNLLAPKANSLQVSRSQRLSDDALLSNGTANYQINGSSETDEPEILRARSIHQRSGHNIRTVQHLTNKNPARFGYFGAENSSSQDLSRELTCLSGGSKKMKSTDDIQISTKRLLGMKRTGLSLSKDEKNYNTDTNGHKRLKKSTERVNKSTCVSRNSTWKPLKQLNRSEKRIDKNRLRTSAEVTMHTNQFLQNSDVLHRSNASSSSQLSAHEPQIWKKTLCLTNEEDHVQSEVEEEDEYDDTDSDEDVAKWHSENRVMHDTSPEHTENCRVTDESRIDEREQDRRSMSRLSKEGALNVSANRCDDFVDNLGVPLSCGKVVERERSDIRTDPCMNSTAKRTMRSFIRSMNPGIHRTANSYDYQSTSPQPSNDSSTGPSSTPCPPDPVLDNGICNYTIMELENNDAQENRCSDIDPIPIPGPPGSFLPSPGNAETDYQGNSSLTASVISSHEQGDGSSLDSPNSAATSLSNLARETSEKVTEKLPSPGIPDSSVLVFPNPSSEFSMDKAPEFSHIMIHGASQSESGEQKNFLKPEVNNQPCCCSRRERVSRGSVNDYQESQLLRRRTMPAVVPPVKENISCSLNSAPSYSCAGSDIYSLSRSSSFQVEAIPVLGTPVGFASPKYSDASKFHSNMDSESASPSAVLRLMGKNLMVAKNDEDSSVAFGDAVRSDANTQMLSREAASPSKLPNNSYCRPQYQRACPPDPAMISPSSSNMKRSLDLDFRMSNGPWGQINFPRTQFANHSQAMLTQTHDMHINRGVAATAPLDHKNGFGTLAEQMHRGTPATTDFRKQVIILDDDDAENEVCSLKNDATILKGTNVSAQDQSRLVYPGFPPASAPIYMRHGPSNTCFPVPFSGHYVNSPQINYSQNGSYLLQGGLFITSSPSKPGPFYSPRLP